MQPHAIFEELRGLRLTSIKVHDPWGIGLPPDDAQIRWPLFGALALEFDKRLALLLGSPLRYLRNQEGSRVGLRDGHAAALGYRIMLCELEEAEAMMHLRPWLPRPEIWWDWVPRSMPVIGRTLQAQPWLDISAPDQTAAVMLDFGEEMRYWLEYRLDLDGAIEFAPEGVRSEPGTIEVSKPSGPFGWLHPRSIRGFVLDDRRWRDAEHWPIDVRRQYRDADPRGAPVLELLKRAWLAFFRQNPDMCRRLLALSVPVRVADLPEGFVTSVRAELAAQLDARQVTAAYASAAPASTPPPAG